MTLTRTENGVDHPLTPEEEAQLRAEWAQDEAHWRGPARIAAIKAEANRRIVAICPEWRQRNLLAQAVLLQDKGRQRWSQEDAQAWSDGQGIWGRIAAIRARSDALEQNPPDNITDDQHWV